MYKLELARPLGRWRREREGEAAGEPWREGRQPTSPSKLELCPASTRGRRERKGEAASEPIRARAHPTFVRGEAELVVAPMPLGSMWVSSTHAQI